uniref:Uncharacterized protein n=1 Tax=Cryptomonas curvata TaxID=233186 RepID=A0A7S0MEJ9_9CRYP|mmetsp:Transcript_3477/g.7642  ORF Transcript_3477/g.7642 Transcript_3477/m.7642 type:complete len:432 (+) Transcript_3477:3-1298(+)
MGDESAAFRKQILELELQFSAYLSEIKDCTTESRKTELKYLVEACKVRLVALKESEQHAYAYAEDRRKLENELREVKKRKVMTADALKYCEETAKPKFELELKLLDIDEQALLSQVQGPPPAPCGVISELNAVNAANISSLMTQLHKFLLEHASSSRSASKMGTDEWTTYKEKLNLTLRFAKGSESQDLLLDKGKAPFWEGLREDDPKSVKKYMALISEKIEARFPSLIALDVKSLNLKFQAPDIRKLCGRSDVAITPKMFGKAEWKSGILIGIELKTVIDLSDFIQAQIGCLLISSNSQFPALQLLTDLNNGGAAYYLQQTGEEKLVLECRVFKSMDELWEFAFSFLSSFPSDVFNGIVSDYPETHCSEVVIKKFKLSDRQPAARVLRDLMDSIEAQNERLEVQYSSVDDYIDEAYCLEGAFSPVRSYFN